MSGPLMESVVALVAEWISLGAMFKLQKLSTSVSGVLREWLDDQIWNRLVTKPGPIRAKNGTIFCAVPRRTGKVARWSRKGKKDTKQVAEHPRSAVG